MPDSTTRSKAPRENNVGLIDLFEGYLKIASRDISTQIPCKVLEVDYNRCLVKVQPTITTMMGIDGEKEVPMLPIEEVPILFEGGDDGSARISTPIQEGDAGVLVFAQRDTDVYLESDGKSLQASKVFDGVGFNGAAPKLYFKSELRTKSNSKPFEKDKVVVEYGASKVTLKKDGEIKSSNGAGTTTINPDGSIVANSPTSISLTCGGSSFVMTPSSVIINGTVFTTNTVTTTNIAATQSLKVAGKEQDKHTHLDGSYVAGSTKVTGTSGEPV